LWSFRDYDAVTFEDDGSRTNKKINPAPIISSSTQDAGGLLRFNCHHGFSRRGRHGWSR
jgi:hypothetical protein